MVFFLMVPVAVLLVGVSSFRGRSQFQKFFALAGGVFLSESRLAWSITVLGALADGRLGATRYVSRWEPHGVVCFSMSSLRRMACNLRAMASNLGAMASNLNVVLLC